MEFSHTGCWKLNASVRGKVHYHLIVTLYSTNPTQNAYSWAFGLGFANATILPCYDDQEPKRVQTNSKKGMKDRIGEGDGEMLKKEKQNISY